MKRHRDRIRPAIETLTKRAESRKLDLDDSFYEELRNYSRHERIRDLPDEVLGEVIEKLGAKAFEHAEKGRVGGGHVRLVTFKLCEGGTWETCSGAAARVSETAASHLRRS